MKQNKDAHANWRAEVNHKSSPVPCLLRIASKYIQKYKAKNKDLFNDIVLHDGITGRFQGALSSALRSRLALAKLASLEKTKRKKKIKAVLVLDCLSLFHIKA